MDVSDLVAHCAQRFANVGVSRLRGEPNSYVITIQPNRLPQPGKFLIPIAIKAFTTAGKVLNDEIKLEGDAIGDILIEPKGVAFGLVKPGQVESRRICLLGSGGAIRIERIELDSPHVEVTRCGTDDSQPEYDIHLKPTTAGPNKTVVKFVAGLTGRDMHTYECPVTWHTLGGD